MLQQDCGEASTASESTCSPPMMPLFVDKFLNPLTDEGDESESEDGDKKETTKDGKSCQGSDLNAMRHDEYERMPYPIIVDSGAAENVMPPGVVNRRRPRPGAGRAFFDWIRFS